MNATNIDRLRRLPTVAPCYSVILLWQPKISAQQKSKGITGNGEPPDLAAAPGHDLTDGRAGPTATNLTRRPTVECPTTK